MRLILTVLLVAGLPLSAGIAQTAKKNLTPEQWQLMQADQQRESAQVQSEINADAAHSLAWTSPMAHPVTTARSSPRVRVKSQAHHQPHPHGQHSAAASNYHPSSSVMAPKKAATPPADATTAPLPAVSVPKSDH